jgi:hypothetical protein
MNFDVLGGKVHKPERRANLQHPLLPATARQPISILSQITEILKIIVEAGEVSL